MADKEAMRDMRRHVARMGLEPIKSMVLSGGITHDQALSLVANATGWFNFDFTPEYQGFRENMGKIFENETFFKSDYDYLDGLGNYDYQPSSKVDSFFLYKLFKYFRGKDYDSPEVLRDEVAGIVKGRRILELGCGPGFGLKVLQDLGAIVTGVELRDGYKGRIPNLDIRYGSATKLEEIFNREKFEIVYSNDLFALACVDFKQARQIVKGISRVTPEGGFGFHLVAYREMAPLFQEFGGWLKVFETGRDLEEYERACEYVSDEEREEGSWTNTATLDPQYMLREGFKIREYSLENNYLTIVSEKA